VNKHPLSTHYSSSLTTEVIRSPNLNFFHRFHQQLYCAVLHHWKTFLKNEKKKKNSNDRPMVTAKLLWFPLFGVFGIRQIPLNRLFPSPIRPVDVPRYSGSVQIRLMSICVGRWSVEKRVQPLSAVSSLITEQFSRVHLNWDTPTIDMSYLTDGSTHTLTSVQTQRGLYTHCSNTNIQSHALKRQTMSVASKQAHTRTRQEGFTANGELCIKYSASLKSLHMLVLPENTTSTSFSKKSRALSRVPIQ